MTVSLNKTSKVELLPLERSVHISEKVQKYVANDQKTFIVFLDLRYICYPLLKLKFTRIIF
jgi:hypothetical protein